MTNDIGTTYRQCKALKEAIKYGNVDNLTDALKALEEAEKKIAEHERKYKEYLGWN
jgi:hypothetical protein